MFRVGLLLLGLGAVVGLADPVALKTDDPKEAPYQWENATCTLGESDLSIYTSKNETNGSRAHFYFRNLADFIGMLTTTEPVALEVTTTKSMGLTFTDREGTNWAFQPKRNQAKCDLKFKKGADGELVLWGKCDKLTPKDPLESFNVGIIIAEESPLKCKLVKGQP